MWYLFFNVGSVHFKLKGKSKDESRNTHFLFQNAAPFRFRAFSPTLIFCSLLDTKNKRDSSKKTFWLQEKESPKKTSLTQRPSTELLCYFFPRCHLRLAVNLCWTCQLSSLITDRPTCFLCKQHPECHGKQTPLLVLLLPHSCQNQKTSGRAWRALEELPSTVPCRVGRECPGLCHLPHGRADAARPGWVWWDVAELQRRPVRLWTITGMWEQRREGPLSQLSATHGGDCQEMEMCQIMFHDFGAHNKLWIGLWARGDECDVSAETDFRPKRTSTDYGSKIRCKHLMEKFDSC